MPPDRLPELRPDLTPIQAELAICRATCESQRHELAALQARFDALLARIQLLEQQLPA